MKLLLSFLFLSGSLLAFGQSAKKVNARLRLELAQEQQKQDSAYQAFFQLSNESENLQNQFGREKERFITESSKTLFYRDSISRLLYNLKRLEQYPEMNDVKAYMEMSNGWYFLQSVLEMAKKVEPIDTVSGLADWNGLELKQQNEQLKLKIAEYQNQAKLNELRMQCNESGLKQLKSAIFRLDSASLVYENATGILLSRKRSLDGQLESLRQNYRLKGPNGFPDNYQTVFPDVYSAPKEDVVHDEHLFNTVNSEKSVGSIVEAPKPKSQEPEVYTVLDEPAEFPGGIAALKKYLSDNIQYPARAKEKEVFGKVYVQFIVSKEGEILNVKLKKGIADCPECDAEAIRLVKSMPKWIPAKNNGKSVNLLYNLPINFKLE